MDTRLLFTGVVLLVALERLVELRLAARNAARALAAGGRETGQAHYRVMKLLHGSFLVAAPLEVWLLDRPFLPGLAAAMFLVLLFTMGIRYWIIFTLKERWNTRIIVVPGWEPATAGPYRFVRHPNYLVVVLELAALPLLHGAYLTALIYSAANAALLWVRIRAEEQALASWPGYLAALGHKPRFVPGGAERSSLEGQRRSSP